MSNPFVEYLGECFGYVCYQAYRCVVLDILLPILNIVGPTIMFVFFRTFGCNLPFSTPIAGR